MLGRICLTLKVGEVLCAERYNEVGAIKHEHVKPEFIAQSNLGMNFVASTNISPGQICPIIVSAQHFNENATSSERSIIPALWGFVPRWHKGDFQEHGFNTINFRVENIDDSRMYKPAFNRGKRCILMCEGYYEWQRIPTKTPPSERSIYFIHKLQPKGVKIDDKSTWTCNTVNLLHIAGIFDVWHDGNENPLYSFTILSRASDDSLNWLHPRSPVILETDEEVTSWLSFNQVSGEKALKLLKRPKSLVWYEVSKCVLGEDNKLKACNKPIQHQRQEQQQSDGEPSYKRKHI